MLIDRLRQAGRLPAAMQLQRRGSSGGFYFSESIGDSGRLGQGGSDRAARKERLGQGCSDRVKLPQSLRRQTPPDLPCRDALYEAVNLPVIMSDLLITASMGLILANHCSSLQSPGCAGDVETY